MFWRISAAKTKRTARTCRARRRWRTDRGGVGHQVTPKATRARLAPQPPDWDKISGHETCFARSAVHHPLRAMDELSDSWDSADRGRQAEPDRARAQNPGRQTGPLRHLDEAR